MRVQVGSCLHVSVAVAGGPGVVVISCHRERLVLRVENRQVQGCRTVATVLARPKPVVVSTGVVSCTVPRVAHACRHRVLSVGRRQDGQVQRHHTVTACVVGEGVRVITAFIIEIECDIAVIPIVALTSCSIYLGRFIASNGQVKRIHLRTVVGILMGVSVVASFGIGLPVTVGPRVGATAFSCD